MEQTKFNTIAIIGCVITLLSFGGTFMSTYIRSESRLSVIEYQVTAIREQQLETAANLKVLQQQKR